MWPIMRGSGRQRSVQWAKYRDTICVGENGRKNFRFGGGKTDQESLPNTKMAQQSVPDVPLASLIAWDNRWRTVDKDHGRMVVLIAVDYWMLYFM